MKHKFFFGWQNIRKALREIVKIYSNEPSFFSKKRVESGISFFVAQGGMIAFLVLHVDTMSSSDIALWAGIEFAAAGYVISQIQREKKNTPVNVSGTNVAGSTDEPANSSEQR